MPKKVGEKVVEATKANLVTKAKQVAVLAEDKDKRRDLGRDVFTKADKDGGGTLDKEEILIAIDGVARSMDLDLPEKDKIVQLFDLCDKNGDGVLSLPEFQVFFKNVLHSYVKHAYAQAEQNKYIIKVVDGAKNGQSRKVSIKKEPKFYPADDVDPLATYSKTGKRDLVREASSGGIAKLRAGVTPGTVLILLSGRFRGRRVVFLKQLKSSGLLLVSGPYGINGIPLRRVNQAYCIATSTKVDVGGVDSKKFDDAYFAKPVTKKVKKDGKDFLKEDAKASTGPSAARAADQKAIDDAMMKGIQKEPMMAAYLKSRFSLSKGDKPHLMKY